MSPVSIVRHGPGPAIALLLALVTVFAGCQKQESAGTRSGTIQITQLPFVITNAGDYEVAADLTGKPDNIGILVLTNHVKIDLKGKSLFGVPKARSAIALSKGVTNVSVFNGKLIGWSGGVAGIFAHQSDFRNLSMISNHIGLAVGCSNSITDCVALWNEGPGLTAHDATVVKNCRADNNIGDGITVGYESVVQDSVCHSNRINGIYATQFGRVLRCETFGNTRCGVRAGTSSTVEQCKIIGNIYDGVEAANGTTIRSNLVERNLGNGIGAFGHATIADNTCLANARDGIRVAFSCRITNNICKFNATADRNTGGIHAVLKGNRIQNNHVFVKETTGIKTSGSPNQVIGNIVYQSQSGPAGLAYECKGGLATEVLKRPKDPADPVIANYELTEAPNAP